MWTSVLLPTLVPLSSSFQNMKQLFYSSIKHSSLLVVDNGEEESSIEIHFLPSSNFWFSTPALVMGTFWFHLHWPHQFQFLLVVSFLLDIKRKRRATATTTAWHQRLTRRSISRPPKEENKSGWLPCREAKLHAIWDTQPWYHGRYRSICSEEWKIVQGWHAVHYPGRDAESLKHKYHSLHRLQIPIGDPNMPD